MIFNGDVSSLVNKAFHSFHKASTSCHVQGSYLAEEKAHKVRNYHNCREQLALQQLVLPG